MNFIRRLPTGAVTNLISRTSARPSSSIISLGINRTSARRINKTVRHISADYPLTAPAIPSLKTEGQMKESMEDFRLPTTIRPINYDLTLKPRLSSGLFDGKIIITANLSEPSDTIKLHSNGLSIKDVEINGQLHNFSHDAQHELLVVSGAATFSKGDLRIQINFSGDMKNRIVGLYTSKYKNHKGNDIYMATSKFEPTYARQAYPCFDEPNMKAKYTVHLLKPKDPSYIALSNMPKDYETEEEDGILVTFKESVPMSTYLSCFIVSDFLASEDVIHSKNGDIPIRVFATPEQLNKTQYALSTSIKVMDYYLKYFEFPYPLPKLDMAAIPDFVSGAMEHWGLVTYRETALLYSPEISSTKNKERVVQVIAHELAHSWFGNLVTMDWWNDIWLNEGFASYMEYRGTDAAEPTWKKLDQFQIGDLHPVLKLDSTLGSHPIVQTVLTPDQITEIFDTISYNKGAAILRMLENSVTEETFRKAVNNYLSNHKYANAVTQNLLDEIQALVSQDIDITDYMNTWTVQMGYPVINVTKINGGYRLTQKRFLTDPRNEVKDKSVTPYKYKWIIPITYMTDKDSNSSIHWFKHTDDHVDITTDAKWIKFNPKQAGYYRVNYDLSEWNILLENIKQFSVPDKAHLLEETFRLAESTAIPYDVPFNLSKYLKEETEYIPWITAQSLLTEIKTYMMSSELYTDFKQYIVKIVTPAYDKFSWDERPDDEFLTKLARITVISLACSMGHTSCMEEAHNKFKRWLDGQEKLSLDLKELVYRYGAQSASEQDWSKLWEIFIEESDAGEKLRLLRGLASVNNVSLLRKLISLAKNETYIRSQDYFTCLSYISYNPVGTDIVWEYVRENWEQLVERFTLNDRSLGKLIPTITGTFSTQVRKDEMTAFFTKYPNAGAGVAARAQALETVDNNINWLANNKQSVENWIVANKNFS